MALVLHFRARPIRRPVAIVAVTQRQLNTALWSWLRGLLARFARPSAVPDNLRQDVGLEPLPLQRDHFATLYQLPPPILLQRPRRG